jgi:hypothetical protein
MTDATILDYLKTRFDRLDTRLGALAREQADHRVRLSRIEDGFAGLKGEIAGLHGDYAGLSGRIDRVIDGLDLADAPRASF